MNAAISSERPGPSMPRLRRRRVLSSPPEESPVHSRESSPFNEEPLPPAKKRRITRKEDTPKTKEVRASHSSATKSASTSSKTVVKGIRGQPPGVKTLSMAHYPKETAIKSHRLDTEAIASSKPSSSSHPRLSMTTYGSSNPAATVRDLLLELKADQPSLRPPYPTDSQLRMHLDVLIAEHLDPINCNFSTRITDLEEMLRRSNERIQQQEKTINLIQMTLSETNLKLQQQDSRFRQYNAKFVRQDEKLSQREADVKRLGERIRQQALEIERLRAVKEQTETYAGRHRDEAEQRGESSRRARERSPADSSGRRSTSTPRSLLLRDGTLSRDRSRTRSL